MDIGSFEAIKATADFIDIIIGVVLIKLHSRVTLLEAWKIEHDKSAVD